MKLILTALLACLVTQSAAPRSMDISVRPGLEVFLADLPTEVRGSA